MNRAVAATSIAGLAFLTCLNVLGRLGSESETVAPLQEGDTFSLAATGLDGREGPLLTGCRVVLVIHPFCGACQALAEAQQRSPVFEGPIWLSVGDRGQTLDYTRDHHIPDGAVFLAGDGRGPLPLHAVGIVGVPTVIRLVDSKVDRLRLGFSGHMASYSDLTCASRLTDEPGGV